MTYVPFEMIVFTFKQRLPSADGYATGCIPAARNNRPSERHRLSASSTMAMERRSESFTARGRAVYQPARPRDYCPLGKFLASCASWASSAADCTPTFVFKLMWCTCTGRSQMPRSSEICFLSAPGRTCSRTSRSRSVSFSKRSCIPGLRLCRPRDSSRLMARRNASMGFAFGARFSNTRASPAPSRDVALAVRKITGSAFGVRVSAACKPSRSCRCAGSRCQRARQRDHFVPQFFQRHRTRLEFAPLE